MIDPKELRLGNFVLNHFGTQVDVTVIDDCIDWAKPISITPEWLERLGFSIEDTLSFSEYFNKSYGNIKAYIIDSIWFCSHFDWMCHKDISLTSQRGWYIGRRNTNQRYKGWNYDGSAEVKYIHQLQNLYFALTGKELIVKP